MPETYTVESAEKKGDRPDKGYGPMQVIALALKDPQGQTHVAEWYTKAATQLPAVGGQLTGDITQGQYGPSFKRVQFPMGGGGSKEYKADPAKQAAIAMESAQKSAVEVLRLAMEQGVWKAPEHRPVAEMAGLVKTIAQSLYAQIKEASSA